MVHQGFQRYGGVEVVNTERLAAYVANGLVPGDTLIDVPAIADGLAAVVTGDGPYTTPLQDLAPWVDLDDPDTFDFAGVLPLDLTGADATTRTVAMIPTTRDGALPGSARRGARTVAESALLIGRTTEGVQAGLAWLQRALHGACDAVEADCGPSATLELFTADPGPLNATANTSVPPATTVRLHPTDPTDPSYGWVSVGGTFDTPADDATTLRPYTADPIDGGISTQTVDAIIDAGGAAGLDIVIDGGSAEPLSSEALVSAVGATCTNGPVVITWSLRRVIDVPTSVQLVIVDDSGAAVDFGPKYDLTDDLADYEWDLPFGVDYDTWRPGIVTGYDTDVAGVSFTSYPDSSPLDCVAPYWRFLPGAVVTSGPIPVETIDVGCAVFLRVEWVWVVGTPYRYGTTTTVLSGLSAETDPQVVLPGVSWSRQLAGTIPATPWNCAAPAPEASCAADPCAPGFGLPPALPVILDPARPRITTQDVHDLWVCVGPEQTPGNDGVFNISLTADAPIVGARVRVWDDTEGDCTVPDPCAFAYEYLIDYVPQDGVLTINGRDGTFTTLCDGGAVLADASGLIAGDFGGPTKEPVARCNRRYFIRVQWLATYPRSCTDVYTVGQPQGDLTVAVAVTPREG